MTITLPDELISALASIYINIEERPMGQIRMVVIETTKTTVTLRQIGRVRLPASTTCARREMPDVVLAIKEEDGKVNAYCAACARRIDDEKTTQLELIL